MKTEIISRLSKKIKGANFSKQYCIFHWPEYYKKTGKVPKLLPEDLKKLLIDLGY